MNRTTFDLERVLADETPLRSTRRTGRNVMESPSGRTLVPGGRGFLRSTARDLTAWVRFLMARDGSRLKVRMTCWPRCRAAGVVRAGRQLWHGLTVNEDHRGVT